MRKKAHAARCAGTPYGVRCVVVGVNPTLRIGLVSDVPSAQHFNYCFFDMTANAVKTDRVRASINAERVVDFEPTAVAAPFALRCGALLADYLLVIVIPVCFLLLSRASGNTGSNLINSGFNDIGWLTGILIAFVSFLLLPIATGKTFGKMATGLRIVTMDGKDVSVRRMIVRQLVAGVLFILTAGLSFFLSALTGSGRALHDYITGTIVIYADKRPRSQ